MIVVLSTQTYETTTDEVLDWIEALGGDCVRLNGQDLNGAEPWAIGSGADGTDSAFVLGGREVRRADVRAVWFRRWHGFAGLETPGVEDAALQGSIRRHLARELMAVTDAVYTLFADAEWVTHPREVTLGKVRALELAARAGLQVPATMVTNRKHHLQAFKDLHGRIITKCAGDVEAFRFQEQSYGMYTAEVTQAEIDAAPEVFFPSLVQAMVEKSFEIRAFYLDGEFHAMAIFSQADDRTAVDFRRYNNLRPNRTVPYRLPAEVRAALRRFMELAGLSTGSVDLVRTPTGEHVFLEVNPGGQFGMVSQPCNYFLERTLAHYLIRRDRREEP